MLLIGGHKHEKKIRNKRSQEFYKQINANGSYEDNGLKTERNTKMDTKTIRM